MSGFFGKNFGKFFGAFFGLIEGVVEFIMTGGARRKRLKRKSPPRRARKMDIEPTFRVIADTVAPAANKHMISLFNASARNIFICGLYLKTAQLTADAGVGLRMDLKYINDHSSGTSLSTFLKLNEPNLVLPSTITARTGATVSSEGDIINTFSVHNDEIGISATDTTFERGETNLIQDPIAIVPNKGISLKNITSSTAGGFHLIMDFRVGR
jgi:hypothetical protein